MKKWFKYVFKLCLAILVLSIVVNILEDLNIRSSIIFGITFCSAFFFGQIVVDLKWRP